MRDIDPTEPSSSPQPPRESRNPAGKLPEEGADGSANGNLDLDEEDGINNQHLEVR